MRSGPASQAGPLDVAAIPAPTPASSDATGLTLEELLDFTPARKLEYEHQRLIVRLDGRIADVTREREDHRAESTVRLDRCDQLREQLHRAEVDLVRLTVTSYGDRWFDIGVTVTALLGSALISSYAKGTGWFAFGWSLVGLSSVFQLLRSALAGVLSGRTNRRDPP